MIYNKTTHEKKSIQNRKCGSYVAGNVKMDYVWQFLLFIAAGLVLNRIEEFLTRKKEAKNRLAKLYKNCIKKIGHCINELDFNIKCVGGPTSPFKTEALEQLLNSEEITLIDLDLINSLKKLIVEAGDCLDLNEF